MASPESVVPLSTGWLFGGRFADNASTQPGFDDSGFERVTVPHSVVPLSWRDWDPATWEAVWIYRRHFSLPAGFEGQSQRVFVDFDGVLSAASPWVNGEPLATHRGGYLPVSYEVTDRLRAGDNLLAVVVDSRWAAVPPNGHPDGSAGVDYFQPGGINRAVSLRAVPQVFVADVFAQPVDTLDPAARRVDLECTVDASVAAGSVELVGSLLTASGEVVAQSARSMPVGEAGRSTARLTLSGLGDVRLWDLEDPALYEVVVGLRIGGSEVHEYRTRIGFREARFENDGFFLNGARVKLFGVNRHQIYPYTGMAMPDRVQRRDALILREEFNCTMVRCAHYPQASAFLDACDELGMLVFEEIPGWQYVGDAAWQDLAVRDVEEMIRRDRNRPSVVTWGVRINESGNFPELYSRTQSLAKQLDPSRQTTGAMLGSHYSTVDFAQDVFSFNDYTHTATAATLREPLPGKPFLVSEAIGALAGPHFYRRTDPQAIQTRQAYLHAQVHDQAAGDDRYAGLLAWQAFDYDSMNGFVNHRLKCNGIGDTFRVPKLGAAIYQAQVDPRVGRPRASSRPALTATTHTAAKLSTDGREKRTVRPVIAPAFYWDFSSPDGRPADGPGAEAMVCSNCERLEVFVGGSHRATVTPDVVRFGSLAYPPSFVDLSVLPGQAALPELRIDGYVGSELVLSRAFASDPSGDRLSVVADDETLIADGIDATRVVFRAVDLYGAPRPYAGGAVTLTVAGPGDLVGDNPFPFADNGGVGAVWVRTRGGEPGAIELNASHSGLGDGTVLIRSRA